MQVKAMKDLLKNNEGSNTVTDTSKKAQAVIFNRIYTY